jgi:ADP-heptose:LPS heptosyltransferase
MIASIVARALHTRFGTVDALTLPGHASALERIPDFDRVFVDANEPERDLAQTVCARGYDAAVVTWATARTAKIPRLARIPIRAGQARRIYSWQFTHRVPVRSEFGDVTSHWSQILLDYARAIGCDTGDPVPAFRTTPADESEAAAILAELQLDSAPFAILHTTNAIAPKRGIWPVRGWSNLARAIAERFNVTVLLSGVPADRPIVERIAEESGARPIAGKASLGGFAALAKRASHFTGITTGSMHVAAAVGCPTVGIFPFQTDTPERWAPLGPRTEIVRASYPCRKGERKETCPDYACIANLDVPRILAACEAVVGPLTEARSAG